MSLIGQKIDCYRVQRKLGAGGMGEVYLAWDESLDRNVAIKLVRPSQLEDPKSQQRFRREARTSAGLSHPFIVQTFRVVESHPEAGEAEAFDCLVMEYLPGCSLRQLMAQERFPWDFAIRILIQIAEGLSYAHGRGVIHRDLKAENVMLTADGQVKILDFGLAKRMAGESSTTGGGGLVGTLYSMAPEQAAGLPVDQRADLFSLGVLAYELCSGRRPFVGETAHQLWLNVLHNAHTPIHEHEPDLPAALADLIERLLEKNPEDRVQQAKHVVAALDPGTLSDTAISFVPGTARLDKLPETLRSRLAEASTLGSSKPSWPPTPPPQNFLRPGFSVRLPILLSLVGVLLLVFWPKAVPERTFPSLAVLPLAGEGGSLCQRILWESWRAAAGVDVRLQDLAQLAAASTSLAAGQEPGARELAAIQSLLAADYLVTGSCARNGDGMEIRASLLRGEDGRRLSTLAEVWDPDWAALAATVNRFSAVIGLPIPAALELPPGLYPRSAEAIWAASSGLKALEAGTTEAAREAHRHFELALEVEPKQPWLTQRLAGVKRRLADSEGAFLLSNVVAEVSEGTGLPPAGQRLLLRFSAEQSEVLNPARAAIERSYLASQGNHQGPSSILETAESLLKSGRPRAALAWLENGHFRGTLLQAHRQILEAKAWYQLTEFASAAVAARSALELQPPALLEARAWFELANANADLGKAGEAEAAYERAEKIFDSLGRVEELFSCREGAILLLIRRGQAAAARSRLVQLREAYSQYGDGAAAARLSSTLAGQLDSAGDFESAIQLYSESIDQFERLKLTPEAAVARQNRATAYHSRGWFAEARRDYLLAEAVLRQLGAVENVAGVLTNLGELDLLENDWSSAERHFAESFELAGADRDPASEAYSLIQRAWLFRSRGNLAAAEADLARARKLQEGLDAEPATVWAIRMEVGRLELAKLNLGTALGMAREILQELKQSMVADPQLAKGLHFEVLMAKLLLARILLENPSATVADREEARSLIQQVLLDPRSPQRFVVLADAKSLEARL